MFLDAASTGLYQLSDLKILTISHAILREESRFLRPLRINLVLDLWQGHEPRDNLALGWTLFHVQRAREYPR